MRLTYSSILAQHLRNINFAGSTNSNILADFNYNLGERYQLILAAFANYKTVKPYTVSTANGQQAYAFPPGVVTIEGGFITIGSVNYPLQPIESRFNIEQLNAITIQASAIPQFYFVEQDSFQIWPIPQAVYTGTIYYHFRDRNLSIADYTQGTVTVTQDSATITGSAGAVFTAAMVGRWFTVTDPTVPGQGYWYRITGYVNSTTLTLGTYNSVATPWTQATASTTQYIIGESPELPEEMHGLLASGTAADFYGGTRKDNDSQIYYNNIFWTGDANNTSRAEGDSTIKGGVLGAISRYSSRDNRRLIKRNPKLNPLQYKVWATSLS